MRFSDIFKRRAPKLVVTTNGRTMEDRTPVKDSLTEDVSRTREILEKQGIIGYVEVEVRDKHGNLKFKDEGYNDLTDAGRDYVSAQMYETGTKGVEANFIALGTGADDTDSSTSMTNEITTAGLSRAKGTTAHTDGESTTTITKQFTATSNYGTTITKSGLFNQLAVGGTFVHYRGLTSDITSLDNGDSVTITWTITISG